MTLLNHVAEDLENVRVSLAASAVILAEAYFALAATIEAKAKTAKASKPPHPSKPRKAS